MSKWERISAIIICSFVVFFCLIFNQTKRIENNKKITEWGRINNLLAEEITIVIKEFDKFKKEHTHYYPHGKPRQ